MTSALLLIAAVAQGLALSLVMTWAWVVQQRTGNSGWIDAVWTFGLGAIGVASALASLNTGVSPSSRQVLVAAIIAIWALRLGLHIVQRSATKTDDPRYGELIRGWGMDARRRMFILLQKQALVSWPLAVSVLLAAQNPAPLSSDLGLGFQGALALLIFVAAILGETIADRQLRAFASKPENKGRVCTVGLWRYSRHPNYFFEWLHWLAYPVLAVDLTGAYPWGWIAFAAPLCMYWLLAHVSGVPPLEEHMVRRHGDAFRAYQARTNAFFRDPRNMIEQATPPTTTASTKIIGAAIGAFEQFPVPDAVTRMAIRALVARTSHSLVDARPTKTSDFARAMTALPIAVHTDAANAQHYEVPANFFALVLGPQRKYSCCLYDTPLTTLAEAEEAALAETARRAGLADGQTILELGCGWGSLSLWMARNFPSARITAVSNSRSQRASIEARAASLGISNLKIVTADANVFQPTGQFDRVVSIEMFEHMSNWAELLARVRQWLSSEGRLFVHVFTHKTSPYRFEVDDPSDWIGRYFFTGGIMPSETLMREFPQIFSVEQSWRWSGAHYERTALDWLANFDCRSGEILDLFETCYGRDARVWHRRWRLFFLATAGLFGHNGGAEWGITHYLLKPA